MSEGWLIKCQHLVPFKTQIAELEEDVVPDAVNFQIGFNDRWHPYIKSRAPPGAYWGSDMSIGVLIEYDLVFAEDDEIIILQDALQILNANGITPETEKMIAE